jgi:homoserine kinase
MLKKISYSNGALSFGISGSGPSVFALCRGIKKAKEIGDLLKKRYNQSNIDFEIHTSLVNQIGINIISTS